MLISLHQQWSQKQHLISWVSLCQHDGFNEPGVRGYFNENVKLYTYQCLRALVLQPKTNRHRRLTEAGRLPPKLSPPKAMSPGPQSSPRGRESRFYCFLASMQKTKPKAVNWEMRIKCYKTLFWDWKKPQEWPPWHQATLKWVLETSVNFHVTHERS